jgi:hypothetical protein
MRMKYRPTPLPSNVPSLSNSPIRYCPSLNLPSSSPLTSNYSRGAGGHLEGQGGRECINSR